MTSNNFICEDRMLEIVKLNNDQMRTGLTTTSVLTYVASQQ